MVQAKIPIKKSPGRGLFEEEEKKEEKVCCLDHL
jgi:hypothetical protein